MIFPEKKFGTPEPFMWGNVDRYLRPPFCPHWPDTLKAPFTRGLFLVSLSIALALRCPDELLREIVSGGGLPEIVTAGLP
jgi:hypothetical protein